MLKKIIVSLLIVLSLGTAVFAATSSKVVFFQRLEASDDNGQCNGNDITTLKAGLGIWTNAIKLDTDDRDGGCYQKFGIYDPDNELKGLKLSVKLSSDDVVNGQCGKTGKRIIPLSTKLSRNLPTSWSSPYFIDTDDRWGGCYQTFSISGRKDVELDIKYYAEDDEGQCGNTGTHTVKYGEPVELRLDMDNRDGGCFQKFRLRKTK